YRPLAHGEATMRRMSKPPAGRFVHAFASIESHLPRRTLLAAMLLAIVSCKDATKTDPSSQSAAGSPSANSKRLKIAVIPKGTTHEFWKSVHAGAVKASKELDVDIVWKGPLKEDDLKAQIDVVNTFVAQGVSGIVVAPLNDAGLRAPVKAAAQAKIPVVV